MDKFTEGEGFFLYYSPEYDVFAEVYAYYGDIFTALLNWKKLGRQEVAELHFIDEVWL